MLVFSLGEGIDQATISLAEGYSEDILLCGFKFPPIKRSLRSRVSTFNLHRLSSENLFMQFLLIPFNTVLWCFNIVMILLLSVREATILTNSDSALNLALVLAIGNKQIIYNAKRLVWTTVPEFLRPLVRRIEYHCIKKTEHVTDSKTVSVLLSLRLE